MFEEGRPARPQPDAGMEATVKWMKTPPKRHHLLHLRDGTVSQVSFENPDVLLTTAHIQQFDDGWLLAEARGGADLRAEFAKQHDLPYIDDCYTLNVVGSSVWLSYYTDFPLGCLRDFKLERAWDSLGANRAFAVRGDRLVIFPAYDKPYLTTRTLENPDTRLIRMEDFSPSLLEAHLKLPARVGTCRFDVLPVTVGSMCTMKPFSGNCPKRFR